MKKYLTGNKFIKSIFLIGIISIQNPAIAQDYSRFLKVKKWKINYELKIDEAATYPAQLLPELLKIYKQFDETATETYKKNKWDPDKPLITDKFIISLTDLMIGLAWELVDADTYSWTFEKSSLKGTLMFDTKEDFQTWIGGGKIDYSINALSKGVLMGSNAGGSILGNGSTSLCSDESWFSVYPRSGTYELFLVPGDGDKAGINVELYSFNTIWEDVGKQIKDQLGKTSDEVIKNELKDIIEASYNPETDDLFYCSDPDKWIVDVEEAKLPANGLIIRGNRKIREGYIISWTIEPADY